MCTCLRCNHSLTALPLHTYTTLAEPADFAGGVVTNTVTINMDQPSVEIPLPLNDDTVSEADEAFLCFFTSDIAVVTNGLATLTVIDNDLGKSEF